MKKLHCLLLLSVVFVLAGCAALKKNAVYVNENELKNFQADPERALIYVFRDKAFFGKGITSQLVVDNVGRLKVDPNEFSVISVAPGQYSLYANSADETNTINMIVHNRPKEPLALIAEAGQIYCFESVFAAMSGFSLKAVSAEEIQPKIKKAKWRDYQKL